MILSENPINMNLKTIEQLLQNAQIILQKDKAEKKEHEARGEYFSNYSAIGTSSSNYSAKGHGGVSSLK